MALNVKNRPGCNMDPKVTVAWMRSLPQPTPEELCEEHRLLCNIALPRRAHGGRLFYYQQTRVKHRLRPCQDKTHHHLPKARKPKKAPPPCGTVGGFFEHIHKTKDKPCVACKTVMDARMIEIEIEDREYFKGIAEKKQRKEQRLSAD